MAEKVKKGDYIELFYVGREKQSRMIFDLNDEDVAKKEGVHNAKQNYDPQIVCVGEKDVIEGLDDALVGKEIGKTFKVTITPDKAFGQKESRLYQLVSASKFKEQKPYLGMQVNVNNKYGIVKTISGGRIMIDFNHPLAGKEVEYEVRLGSLIKEDKEKIASFMKMYLNMSPEIEVNNKKATISLDVPGKFANEIIKKIKERIPSLKEVEFKAPKEEKKKSASKKE